MKKYLITNIDNSLFTLENENNLQNVYLHFFADVEIEVGDSIFMHESLLDKSSDNYIGDYTFGELESQFGKADVSDTSTEYFKLEKQNGENILLKRIYG